MENEILDLVHRGIIDLRQGEMISPILKNMRLQMTELAESCMHVKAVNQAAITDEQSRRLRVFEQVAYSYQSLAHEQKYQLEKFARDIEIDAEWILSESSKFSVRKEESNG